MRIRGGGLGGSAALCLAFATLAMAADVRAVPAAPAATPVHRIIVRLRVDTPSGAAPASSQAAASPAREQRQMAVEAQALGDLAARNELTLRRARRILPGLQAIELTPRDPGQSLQATLARLRADPAVLYAEADQQRHVLAAPNDPLYLPTPGATGQWYLQAPVVSLSTHATPSALDAIDAWGI